MPKSLLITAFKSISEKSKLREIVHLFFIFLLIINNLAAEQNKNNLSS